MASCMEVWVLATFLCVCLKYLTVCVIHIYVDIDVDLDLPTSITVVSAFSKDQKSQYEVLAEPHYT